MRRQLPDRGDSFDRAAALVAKISHAGGRGDARNDARTSFGRRRPAGTGRGVKYGRQAKPAYGEEKVSNGFAVLRRMNAGSSIYNGQTAGKTRGGWNRACAARFSGCFHAWLLRHLMTRIYFSGEAANAEDLVLQLVPANRRETLLATTSSGVENELQWDIFLQGKRETVFFEV